MDGINPLSNQDIETCQYGNEFAYPRLEHETDDSDYGYGRPDHRDKGITAHISHLAPNPDSSVGYNLNESIRERACRRVNGVYRCPVDLPHSLGR